MESISCIHSSVTYRGIVRDDSFGNPTGAIKLTPKKIDMLGESRDSFRGMDQVAK